MAIVENYLHRNQFAVLDEILLRRDELIFSRFWLDLKILFFLNKSLTESG